MNAPAAPENGPGGTVSKALAVLDQVAAYERPVRFTELLADSPLPKATLYRMLQTLVHNGMITLDAERQTYGLGLRLVRLAHSAWTQASIAPVARPVLNDLSEAVGETIHLAQLDHGQVLYVDKRNAARPLEMFSQAGKVGPAYCTGVGKAMLAYLPEAELEVALRNQSFHSFTPSTLTTEAALRAELDDIRAKGLAFDREEHEPGIICMAVPILSQGRRPLAALSVTTSLDRSTLADLEALAPRMQSAARRIAQAVEHWNFPTETTAHKLEA